MWPCEPQRAAAERGWAEDGFHGIVRAQAEWATSVEGFSPREIAMLYSYLGETDEAFVWLEQAYRERDPTMVALKWDLRMAPLHSDPRWADLLRRIGFPEG